MLRLACYPGLANPARRVDPQPYHYQHTALLHGRARHCHTQAAPSRSPCNSSERTWTVLTRGQPYQFHGRHGTP